MSRMAEGAPAELTSAMVACSVVDAGDKYRRGKLEAACDASGGTGVWAKEDILACGLTNHFK